MDIETVMIETLLNVIFNWSTIKQDINVMDILDMRTNEMCIQLKNRNPTMKDSHIQAYAYTVLIMMAYVLINPIPYISNDILDISNDTLDISKENNIDITVHNNNFL